MFPGKTRQNKPKHNKTKTKTNQAKQAKENKTKKTRQNKQRAQNKTKENKPSKTKRTKEAKSGPGWNRATTESFFQSRGCSGKVRLIQVATGPVARWGVRSPSTCLPGAGRGYCSWPSNSRWGDASLRCSIFPLELTA